MQIERAWLEAAELALTEHAVTLALLPMDQVLAADGYLAKLERRGYVVQGSDASQTTPSREPATETE
ncbi:hypothetical protein [Lysobacter sp. F6437]|uniref:hypothetical protein n=1 Tax=Lysobacter sp. F6437 TaxID=3459296 RepID=UPI00403DFB8B